MSNIRKIILATSDGVYPYIMGNENEYQLMALRRKRSGLDFNWSSKKNTHIYNSIKGGPIWLPIIVGLRKSNPLDEDVFLCIETREKIDVFDYVKEIKDSLKPEMFTILKTGLSEVVGIKDDDD